MCFLLHNITDNIVSSHKIIEKFFFPGTDFWKNCIEKLTECIQINDSKKHFFGLKCFL